jgi:hypothetical protein
MFRVRLLLLLLLLPLPACADGAIDTSQKEAAAADNLVHITLGESTVELAGPWKFHVGDNPEWAQPDFDDSGWEDMDLTPGSSGLARGFR